MMVTRKKVIFTILAVIVLAGAVTGWLVDRRIHYPRQFSRVDQGLMRSAQPTPDQLDRIRGRYGLKTVICVREFDPRADWQAKEERWCDEHGVDYVHIPIVVDIPSREQTMQFLRASRPEHQPALVHCELGRSRTGKMVAAYRIVMQDQTPAAAFQEMLDRGFHGTEQHQAQVKQWLAEIERDKLALRQEAAMPATAPAALPATTPASLPAASAPAQP